MGGSRLDALYRRLLITKFFTKGWGTPENLQRIFQFRKIISKRETCFKLIPRDYPVEITKNEIWPDCRVLEGKFLTPLDLFLPNLVPAESKHAVFQIILPLKWKDDNFKPICVHLAGTGDHKFWRRRHLMAKPLLKEAGIGSIILENPFYGYRKPTDQVRSCLNNVSDIFVMGGCLILECLVLFHWCERNGLGPLGVTGLSMGGHMASLAACNWPKPLVLVPCLSWSTASATFTQGVMSQSINWDLLELQYYSDGAYSNKLSKMVTIVDNAFLAGQHFAKNFNQSMEGLKRDMQQINDCYILEKNVTSISSNISLQSLLDQNSIEDNLDNVLDGMPETVLSKVTSKKEFELSSQEINSLNEHFAELHKESVESNNMNIKQMNKDSDVKFEDTINSEVNLSEIVHQLGNDNNLIHSVNNKNNITTQLVPFIEKSKTILNFSMFKTDKPKIDITKISWRDREALQFMRGVMDECTHLSNFSVPFDTSLIIAVCAKDDAYIPRDDCGNLEEIWPGSEVRYINAGHVTAYVLYQKCFRNCIIEAFERTRANFKGTEKSATLQL